MAESKQLDRFKHNDITLTLATWDSGFGPSPEISYRDGQRFMLIQWQGIRTQDAWDFTKRLVVKGKSANMIQKILDRIGN